MPKGIGYGSKGPAPYKATAGKGGGSEKTGPVQSPYKMKDRMVKRSYGGRKGSR
jgi:hypothetical protein